MRAPGTGRDKSQVSGAEDDQRGTWERVRPPPRPFAGARGGARVRVAAGTEAGIPKGMVGARGIAPPPTTTFRSSRVSPSLRRLPTGSRAHDATVVSPRRRTRHRPRGRRGRSRPGCRIGEGSRPPPRTVALNRQAPPGRGLDDGVPEGASGLAGRAERDRGRRGSRRTVRRRLILDVARGGGRSPCPGPNPPPSGPPGRARRGLSARALSPGSPWLGAQAAPTSSLRR